MDAVSDVQLVRFSVSDYRPEGASSSDFEGWRTLRLRPRRVLSRHHFLLSIDQRTLWKLDENREIFLWNCLVSKLRLNLFSSFVNLLLLSYSSLVFLLCAFTDIYIYSQRWEDPPLERKLIKIHIAHINEGESIFIAVGLDGFSRGTIQSPCPDGYGSRAVGREFVFQEHHVDVLADFNRICTVRSTACHSSSSSLEFDLLIHPLFTLSFLSLSLLHHLCPFDHGESILSDSGSRWIFRRRSFDGWLSGAIRGEKLGERRIKKEKERGRERRRRMGIILGKARKLALASFNIRFILFPATMLGDSLFLRASLLSLPLF